MVYGFFFSLHLGHPSTVLLEDGKTIYCAYPKGHGSGGIVLKKSGECAYPAMELLPDGTIAATTYGHWYENESPYILSVRFKMEEIDEMRE